MRYLAFLVLLGLAACNRHGVADVTLDADAAQRNTTSDKTLEDLAAADAASRGPVPKVHDARPAPADASAEPDSVEENEAAAPGEDASEADTNG
jgi:hypothetical protein